MKLQRFGGDDLFKRDATFRVSRGLSDGTKVSFASFNYPNHYIRHRNFSLHLETGSDALFRSDSTFQGASPLW